MCETKRKFKLINSSHIETCVLEKIARELTKNADVPKFYLLCKNKTHDGVSITNIDKPIMVISVKSIEQFGNVLKHELIHLRQHQGGYSSEDFTKEIVVTG